MEQNLKKILILSYFFPPANFAGSYRVASWAKHFHRFGWYPIIITRQWNPNQSDTTQKVIDNELTIEKYGHYEVHRVPYKQNLRDRIDSQPNKNGFSKVVQKLLTFLEIILQSRYNFFIPFKSIYFYAQRVIETEKDISLILVSGRPFQLFRFAHLLFKKYGIKWVADYRDEWNTHSWLLKSSLKNKIIIWIESHQEKAWTASASYFIAPSQDIVNNINQYIRKNGKVIFNGYEEDTKLDLLPAQDVFSIVHSGTLYSFQPVDIFCNGYKMFLQKHTEVNTVVHFVGLGQNSDAARIINNILSDFPDSYTITDRIPKSAIAPILAQANLLLLVSPQDQHGTISSKAFEYLFYKKPVLLSPSDHSLCEQLLVEEVRCGIVANTAAETALQIEQAYENHVNKHAKEFTFNEVAATKYSRLNQAKELGELLDLVVTSPRPLQQKEQKIRNILASTLHHIGVSKFLRNKKKEAVTALCFHRITYEQDIAYPSIRPDVFEGIIRYCKKHYQIISLDEMEIKSNKPKLIITFDDGYDDFREYAHIILKKYNLPCVMSIVTDTVTGQHPFWTQRLSAIVNHALLYQLPIENPITHQQILPTTENAESIALQLFQQLIQLSIEGRTAWLSSEEQGRNISLPRMLDTDAVQKLSKDQVQFISHTKSHPYLPYEAEKGNLAFIRSELMESKAVIESINGKTCSYFATPNGHMQPEVTDIALHEAGYKYVLSTKEDFYTPQTILKTKEIPRILMYRNHVEENILRLEGFHKKVLKHV